jgi:hypothetical protein
MDVMGRNLHRGKRDGKPVGRHTWTVHGFFLSIINLVILFISSVRFLASAAMAPSSLPTRNSLAAGRGLDDGIGIDGDYKHERYENEHDHDHDHKIEYEKRYQTATQSSKASSTRVPILEFSVWSCASSLIELSSRMPWLSGFLSLLQHAAMNGPGHFGRLDGTLDR